MACYGKWHDISETHSKRLTNHNTLALPTNQSTLCPPITKYKFTKNCIFVIQILEYRYHEGDMGTMIWVPCTPIRSKD